MLAAVEENKCSLTVDYILKLIYVPIMVVLVSYAVSKFMYVQSQYNIMIMYDVRYMQHVIVATYV